MSINIKLDLPEDVAAQARAKGLLDPQALARLIQREIVSELALKNYREMVEAMRSYPDQPMTMDEIQAEVSAVRTEQRGHRESGR